MFIFKILRFLFLHLQLATTVVEEFIPSISGWPTLLFALCFSIYWYGHIKGTDSCENKHVQIEAKMEQKNDKIKTNNDKLVHDQLANQLRKYTRD